MKTKTHRRTLLKAIAALPLMQTLSARAQQGPIRIGSILSVTGPAAFLGEDMKAGMELAIDEINARGGINGRKIEWFFYDAESQTQKGLNALRRLMTQDNVDMVIGGGSMSGMALAMLQVTERAQLPFISTEGSMQIVNPVAERPWTFKATADDDQVFERLADYFAKRGIRKVALLADSSGFGQSAVEQAKKVAPRRGLDMVYETFNPTDTDLTPQLSKLKGAGVQAIICWTVASSGVVFMKQARSMGIDAQLIHSYGFVDKRYMDLAGDAARDVLIVGAKFPVGEDLPASDPSRAPILALTKNFEERYKRRANMFVTQSYDSIQLARIAIERAGTDRTKIRDALSGVRGYQGVGGLFEFSPERHSGLTKNDLVLMKYEGGRFRLADYK
jgi:branched-chain amino acid transport system substrate-binding protein